MTTPEWRSEVRLLVVHPDAPTILRPGDAAALPLVTIDERVWPGEPAAIVAAARAVYRIELNVLFCVRDEVDKEAATVDSAVVCEVASAPEGWVPADGLGGDLGGGLDAELVRAALDRLAAGPGGAPWTAPGWHATAGAWLRDVAGLPPGPVEQVRTWVLSAVLRAPAGGGYVYLKASPDMPLFAAEGEVTRVLARLFPESVPTPLAVDAGRRWLATADFGSPLGWEAPAEARVALVRDFARLQVASVGSVASLAAAGCVDRSLDQLSARYGEWLTGADAHRHLTDDEYDALLAVLPRLPSRCAALAAHGLPDALLHGDMHPGNVARTAAGHLFFDWTDAAIGHPFLDMFLISRENDAELAASLRAAYLGEWEAFAGRDLSGAWEAAVPLIAAHHAISYVSLTSSYLPRDASMDGAAGSFLRALIAAL